MNTSTYVSTYRDHLRALIAAHGEDVAMDLVVGGQSTAIGILEHSVLSTLGLKGDQAILDVGCGSGRLSSRLASRHEGRYIGTDLLEDMVAYAARKANRSDWSFSTADRPPLPAADKSIDFVCYFSVFTHLLDEDIYRYLEDSRRVLKDGGQIVFSFLDFAVPSHWTIFSQTLADLSPNRVLNKFVSKDAIVAWAQHLQLDVVRIYDGPEPWIEMIEDITYIDGRKTSGIAEFGQSVAVLRNRSNST